MNRERLTELLTRFRSHEMSLDEVLRTLQTLPYEDLGDARVDHHRALRQGLPEVIYGAGKSPLQIRHISESLLRQGANVLVTRAPDGTADALASLAPNVRHHPRSALISIEQAPTPSLGRLAVVSAGTSDLPVAEEAVETARFFGAQVETYHDVGVAGIHRILSVFPAVESADVVIVVAGMDGALPSVVGGLVSKPVIAVPTSVGYGASFEGVAALLSMLNSCAAGVLVVNIDNGFGAAHAACRILRTSSHQQKPGVQEDAGPQETARPQGGIPQNA